MIDVTELLEPKTVLMPGYTVVDHLCRNEATDIYDVWSEERACRCVAKVVRPDRAGEERPRERLLREGRLLQTFTHPHIVRAYETVETPQPIVILEALTGDTLERIIEDPQQRLTLVELVWLGLHLCSALHYLHGRGVLHLDIKPGNIIAEHGMAKVLDLSLAGPPGPGVRGRGTRGYLAPEQARGGMLTEATDVWGLGVTLFEATTKALPFHPKSRSEHTALTDTKMSLRARRRVPKLFATSVEACLQPEPERRPTIADLVTPLTELLHDRGLPAPHEPWTAR